MKVLVLFFADLKDITKKEKEIIEININSLRELLNSLFQKYKTLRQIIWDDSKKDIKNTVSIAINDKIIHKNNILSIKLFEADRVAFLLPVSGG